MKFEFSAGGIVYKRERTRKGDGSLKNAKILLCQHSQHHGWVFPKGLIDKTKSKVKSQKSKVVRETKEEAALREVREETGVYGKIIKPLPAIEYWYKLNNEKIKKTVYYFLMEYVSGDIKNHDFEMENVEWLAMDKIGERLTYKSDKEVWKEAMSILNIKD